jgi:FlaA1/EpsC-like NDP-sugar epimerase
MLSATISKNMTKWIGLRHKKRKIMKKFLKKIYSKLPILIFDLSAIPVAWYFSFFLITNLNPINIEISQKSAILNFFLLLPLQIFSFYHFKIYRGIWHFFSLNDVVRIIKSVAYPSFILVPMSYWYNLPHAIFPLFSMCLINLLCFGRFAIRQIYINKSTIKKTEQQKNILIIGAGFSGERLAREIKINPDYQLIGFLDDNPQKTGLDIHGFRVLGNSEKLPQIVKKHDVDMILIAIPSAKSAQMRQIVALCSQTKVPFRTLPSLSNLMSKKIDLNNLRSVSLEDLIGRDEVPVIDSQIEEEIANAKVIVTGGGGSIGSELCRQILKYQPKSLLILDNNEFNLYSIHHELSHLYPEQSIEISLVSITDEIAIETLFQDFQADLVFHAAAFKHVPLLESQPRLAILNNVIGTQIVATASVNANVKKFVLISSDKAVNPTNVMGTTKRIAEIYCQNLNNRVDTKFITVRFGNVLGSAGSVVPLFQKQLNEGGPITVTHPDIERFFMTIPEASQLILQAMSNGIGGEIFVLDMGKPVKITYLAEQMIRLAGKKPGEDIQIEFTGLRPGEKLFEELFYDSESLLNTEHAKLFKAKYSETHWSDFIIRLNHLKDACHNHQNHQIKSLLNSLVPEYKPESTINVF